LSAVFVADLSAVFVADLSAVFVADLSAGIMAEIPLSGPRAGLNFTPLNFYPMKSSYISPGLKDYLTGDAFTIRSLFCLIYLDMALHNTYNLEYY